MSNSKAWQNSTQLNVSVTNAEFNSIKKEINESQIHPVLEIDDNYCMKKSTEGTYIMKFNSLGKVESIKWDINWDDRATAFSPVT